MHRTAGSLTERCQRLLLELAACFKNSDYALENEWRVLTWGRDLNLKVNHRTAAGRIAPCVEIAVHEFGCKAKYPPFIRTGPAFPAHQIAAAQTGIQSLLAQPDAVISSSCLRFDP